MILVPREIIISQFFRMVSTIKYLPLHKFSRLSLVSFRLLESKFRDLIQHHAVLLQSRFRECDQYRDFHRYPASEDVLRNEMSTRF